jgi:hypothetical protein
MRRYGFIVLLLLVRFIFASGEPVSKQRLRSMAGNFISEVFPEKEKYDIREIIPLITPDNPGLYAINLDPKGWILASADDKAEPVIGFSFKGSFDPDFSTFPSVNEWIHGYHNNIKQIISDKTLPMNRLWDDPGSVFRLKSTMAETVEPFIPVEWNQNAGWNRFCPEDEEGPGGHTYVGCVAVAMSQAMTVFKYPNRGTGTSSYTHDDYGTITVQYDKEPEYAWDSMAIDISDEYNALLLYHAAVAVKMDFGTDGSGSRITRIPAALSDYYKYYNGVKRVTRYADDEAWRLLLVGELMTGHPVIYSGDADDGEPGHAFDIDGVLNGKYFHINWGWGGKDNGYFTIDNLDPGDYNFFANHEAVVNIRPPVIGPSDLDLTKKSVKEGLPAGTFVGLLKITDEVSNNEYTVMVKGDSIGPDEYLDPEFYLSGDSLKTGKEFNYNEQSQSVLYIEVADTFGHTYQEKFIIEILENTIPSATALMASQSIQIYPNPSAGHFYVRIPESGEYTLELIDQYGRTVCRKSCSSAENSIEIHHQVPGIYLLMITPETGSVVTRKVLIY